MSKKKLFNALAEAQKSLASIGKDGDGPRGEYVTVDSAVSASKAALALHGLSLVQISLRLEELAGVPLEDGDDRSFKRRLVLKREMILIHTESGETQSIDQTWPINMHGSREKAIDHSVAAADSFGLTYLLRGLLLFPRGDEHDTTDRVNDRNRDRHGARTYDNYERDDAGQVVDKQRLTPSADRTKEVVDYAALLLTGKLPLDACEAIKGGAQTVKCTAETLTNQGWTKSPNPEDLAAVGEGILPDPLKQDLWKSAVSISGADKVKRIWGALVPAKTNPTGYQALVIATLCTANPR